MIQEHPEYTTHTVHFHLKSFGSMSVMVTWLNDNFTQPTEVSFSYKKKNPQLFVAMFSVESSTS